MQLTTEQLATLKTAILADANLVAARTAHDTQAITNYLNTSSTLDVWRTSVSTQVLFDQITWANLTPNDQPDGTLDWQCRSLACQGKQFNLQLIFASRDVIDASKSNFRAGLQDALTNVPSGQSGPLVSAAWVRVRTAMQRKATVLEAIFANTQNTPASLVVEGTMDEMTIRRLGWSDLGVWQL